MRIKRGVNAHKKRVKILKSAKGYGTANERDNISDPKVGQLFFVLAE